MKITLNQKEYKLNFGVGFVIALDKQYNTELLDIEFGTGVNTMYMRLQSDNPSALYEVLKATLVGQYELTETDFDAWVDSLESDEAYTSFFKELLTNLETRRQTGRLIANYKKVLNDLEKNQAKKPTSK